jgi:integrase
MAVAPWIVSDELWQRISAGTQGRECLVIGQRGESVRAARSLDAFRERRDVDLISDVVGLLARRRRECPILDERECLVFHTEDKGGFLSPTIVLRRQLYPAMVAAGILRVGPTQEKRTFHSLRHTFAKRALERGAQITWLSRHLGHSSLKVTTDIYGHWERAERKLQAAKMEDAFPV